MSASIGHPRIVVLTAPSGSGKTTIAHRVMEAFPDLRFSVSVTTRPPRPNEQHGIDYYFASEEEFRRLLAEGDLLEYEEVYPGRFYGTLKSAIEAAAEDAPVLLDVEVKGAKNVKRYFGDNALTIFVQPPSLEVLAERLQRRGTETAETLQTRLARAKMELAQADHFDRIIVNDNLDTAVAEAVEAVGTFLHDD